MDTRRHCAAAPWKVKHDSFGYRINHAQGEKAKKIDEIKTTEDQEKTRKSNCRNDGGEPTRYIGQ